MFKLSSEFKERYYNFIYKYFNLEKDIKLLPVDFNKPWYQILLDQKWNLVLQIVSEVVQSTFLSLAPIILGIALFNNKIEYFYYFIIAFIVLEILNRYIIRHFGRLLLQSMNSISYAAYKYFLSVDPIYHSTKSSGQIINKIETTTKEMESLVSLIVESLLPTVIGFITVVLVMASFDYRLGIVGIISFFLIAFMSIAINYFNAEVFKKKRIKANDRSTAKAVETLQQNSLIRASFASNEQIESLKNSYLESMNINTLTHQAFGLTRTITRTAYAISNLIVGIILFELVNTNQINVGVGLSILIAYFNGSGPIMKVGNMIRNSIQSISRQEDLFDFIRQFGVQTYPVLEGDKIDENVALQIQKLEEKQKEYLDGKK